MKNILLQKTNKGFTLIEIIVVFVIMAILLAIAVPSVMGYVEQARNQVYIAKARSGYLGAQTIVAKGVGNGITDNMDLADLITKTSVANEIGLVLPDDDLQGIQCVVKNKKVSWCEVLVSGKKVSVTSNKTAEIK